MYKRVIFTAGIVCVALFFILPALAQDDEAKIVYIKGEVKLQKAGQISWVTAGEGMIIEDGDRIKTFKNSTAEIAIDKDKKNIIKIEQETEMLMEKIKDKRSQLSKGKVLALLEALEPGSDFEVRTPTAVCGVAGSGMFVQTDGNKTTAGCHEDQAYAKGINKDGSFTSKKIIEEGYKCIIEKFTPPGSLIALTEQEQKQWSEFREAVREHMEGTKEQKSEEPVLATDFKEDKTETQREDRLEKDEQKRREDATEKPTTSGGYY